MLEEYKDKLWQDNLDSVNLRSDILVNKRVMELLGNIKGKKILDDGCGNGKVSRMLTKNGVYVYGVDKTPEQIDTAKKVSSNILYFVGDMAKLDEIDLPKDFDIVISLMAFLYLDPEQFIQALVQIRGHLKKEGRFVYANIHPSRYPGKLKVEDEFPTTNNKIFKTAFYNHSLFFIKDAFVKNGFIIKNILEPLPTKSEIEKYPILFSQNTENPQYLIIEATL